MASIQKGRTSMKKTNQQVSLYLDESWLVILKEKAHRESLSTGNEVKYADLVRAAIASLHPEVLEAELAMAEEREG